MTASVPSEGLRSRRDPPLRFAPPDIDESDVNSVVEVLRSGWLTTGSKVREFEDLLAQRVGRRHAIAVTSATAALHLALDAIALTSDDEVIVPTTTFTATAEVVRYFDAKPVLVDVARDTLNIDPEAIRRALTPRTRAIIPVHLGGHAADMDAISSLSAEHNLVVIEDAAHGFPGRYGERDIGTLGDLAAFSFYATKTITTGEGGMLLTDDDRYENRARIMSLHGMSRDAWNRYSGSGSWRYDVIAPGFKYNMTDLAAALGVSQLAKANGMLERRREIARRYTEAFSGLPQLEPPQVRDGIDHSWHLYILRLNLPTLRIDRDAFIRVLAERGIATSVHFIPLHMFTYYRRQYGYRDDMFPVASSEFARVVSLPIYSAMSDLDIDDVVGIVCEVAAGSSL